MKIFPEPLYEQLVQWELAQQSTHDKKFCIKCGHILEYTPWKATAYDARTGHATLWESNAICACGYRDYCSARRHDAEEFVEGLGVALITAVFLVVMIAAVVISIASGG